MIDRYIKTILTLIAGALIYLCVILTPLTPVSAQSPSRVPGVSSGPTEVVIVGIRQHLASDDGFALPVSIAHPVQITTSKPLTITGQVTTERSSNRADRVVLVGWEEGSARDRVAALRQFPEGVPSNAPAPLPVKVIP
jgi:hypothetical protein